MKAAMSCGPMSNCTIKMYCPVSGGFRILVFTLAPRLFSVGICRSTCDTPSLRIGRAWWVALHFFWEECIVDGQMGWRLPPFCPSPLDFQRRRCGNRFSDICICRGVSWLRQQGHMRAIRRTLRPRSPAAFWKWLPVVKIRGKSPEVSRNGRDVGLRANCWASCVAEVGRMDTAWLGGSSLNRTRIMLHYPLTSLTIGVPIVPFVVCEKLGRHSAGSEI